MKLRPHLFKGRINGSTFLVSSIIASLYYLLLSIPAFWAGSVESWMVQSDTYTLLSFVVIIFGTISFIWFLLVPASLCSRRAHDLNKSTILGLGIALIPFGWLYLVLKSGTKGRNKFGSEPTKQNYFLVPLGIELAGTAIMYDAER